MVSPNNIILTPFSTTKYVLLFWYLSLDILGININRPVSQQLFPSGEQPEYLELAHEL